VSCRYHLLLNLSENGKLRCSAKDDKVKLRWDAGNERKTITTFVEILAGMSETCALDIVERNPDGMTLGEVADYLGLDMSRVERAQQDAFNRLRAELPARTIREMFGRIPEVNFDDDEPEDEPETMDEPAAAE
jgi:hypothetical protein